MESRFSVNSENAAWRMVEGEVVILNAETTYYYSLNPTGTIIWKLLLDDFSTVPIIATFLVGITNQSQDVLERVVKDFLDQLEDEQLILSDFAEERNDIQPDPELIMADISAGFDETEYEAPVLLKHDSLQQLIVSAE